MRVLVFGGQGELGRQIAAIGKQNGHKTFAFVSKEQLAPSEFEGEFKSEWNDVVTLNRAFNRQNAIIFIAASRAQSFRVRLEQLKQLVFMMKKYRVKNIVFINPFSWWVPDQSKRGLSKLLDPFIHLGDAHLRDDLQLQMKLIQSDNFFEYMNIYFPSLGNSNGDDTSWKHTSLKKLSWQDKKPAKFYHFLSKKDLAHKVWDMLEKGNFSRQSYYLYKSPI